MKRVGLLGLLMLAAGTAQAGDVWSSLWRTPDQRGEQLLRQGDAAAAARTFADPQRKAYAELKAGDYPAAARDLAAFDSSDADYNRGNALAHTGDLQAALKAYDAALARDPNNRDARHNRDLVAQALKQSKPPAASSQNQNSQQNPGKGANNKASDKGSDKGSGKGAGKAAASDQSSGGQQSGKPGQQQQAGKSGSKPGEQGQPGAQAQGKNPANPASAGTGTPQPNPANGNEAEQARRDAEAALGKQARQQANSQTGTGQGELAGEAARPGQRDTQRSEQQLAQDQWLRQIPDDPGGLLRRKFLIEHLMRQQGNQP